MNRNIYGLLVGINNYPKPLTPLHGCINDITAVEEYLKERVIKEDYQLHLIVLKDEQATRQAVIKGFREHLCRANSNDVALFYYSGHGSQEAAPKEFWTLEPDRLDETLVCWDSRLDGKWDLADKELAKLIAEVAEKQPHIAVILDCCHSGSGTRDPLGKTASRRVPSDKRQRPLDSFICSLNELGNLSPSRSPQSNPSGWNFPRGRHVLLAGCRDYEEAQESYEDGLDRGVFSYYLMEALQKASGALTYRDLFKRANAIIRTRVAAQSPQLEATNFEDLNQAFLGGAIAEFPPYFTAYHHKEHGWVIDGGAVHGITSPTDEETTLLALFPFDSSPEQLQHISDALAEAEIEAVLPHLSKLKITQGIEHLQSDSTFKAVVTSLPLPPLTVSLEGDDPGIDLVRQALQTAGPKGQPSLYIREAEIEEKPVFRLLADNEEYIIVRPAEDRPLVTQIQGYTQTNAGEVVKNLEHIARWITVLKLSNPCNSRIKSDDVQIYIYPGEEEKEAEIKDSQMRLEYWYDSDQNKWREPTFRIKLKNNGSETLFCALFDLTERFAVDPILQGGTVSLEPKQEEWVLGVHGSILQHGIVPKELWQQGVTEYNDRLKLIVCTTEFDATLFKQGKLGDPLPNPTRKATRGIGTLNRLLKRTITREIGNRSEEDERYDDWVANAVTFTFVRPQDAEAISVTSTVSLGAGVTLQPHPNLQAKARLTTVPQSSRDLGNRILPPLLREDAEICQPLRFTASRGTDPGLSVLQLNEVANGEAVTPETPLTLISEVPLADDEYVLPVAWDGEFFLPLGHGKTKNGSTEIKIERLPEPIGEGKRSVTGSIRIFFEKIVTKTLGKELSKKLGLKFEYPILAVAKVENGKVNYITEEKEVKAQVAKAEKILLYIHGIFGDTKSMVSSVETVVATLNGQSQPLNKLYDLVLTFDYENINTEIERNARKLKTKLKDIGLVPGHGKTLHLVAHSMGGLVSRWFIEKEDGHQIVQHLIMLGTPNAGSPWPQVQSSITIAVAFLLNGLSISVLPLKFLGHFLERLESIDVTLDEMEPASEFLQELQASQDPGVPYTIVAGNTSLIKFDPQTASLRSRLLQLLGKTVALPFGGEPNDIAVKVNSMKSVPKDRFPAPQVQEVACNHLVYFTHQAGLDGLGWAISQALK